MELIIKIMMPTKIDLAALIAAKEVGAQFDQVLINNQGHIVEFADIYSAAKMIMEVRNIVDSMIKGN